MYGVELELRKDILNNEKRKLSLNLNTSIIESEQRMSDEEFKGRVISNPDKEISNTRELQGQSPYLVNLGLVYNLFTKDLDDLVRNPFAGLSRSDDQSAPDEEASESKRAPDSPA